MTERHTEERDRDPQEAARERQRERAETVEHVVEEVQSDLSAESYPVRKEELVEQYADAEMELPNETETLGDVIDRLSQDRFDSAEAVREAVLNEVTGEAGGPAEANDERDLSTGE